MKSLYKHYLLTWTPTLNPFPTLHTLCIPCNCKAKHSGIYSRRLWQRWGEQRGRVQWTLIVSRVQWVTAYYVTKTRANEKPLQEPVAYMRVQFIIKSMDCANWPPAVDCVLGASTVLSYSSPKLSCSLVVFDDNLPMFLTRLVSTSVVHNRRHHTVLASGRRRTGFNLERKLRENQLYIIHMKKNLREGPLMFISVSDSRLTGMSSWRDTSLLFCSEVGCPEAILNVSRVALYTTAGCGL